MAHSYKFLGGVTEIPESLKTNIQAMHEALSSEEYTHVLQTCMETLDTKQILSSLSHSDNDTIHKKLKKIQKMKQKQIQNQNTNTNTNVSIDIRGLVESLLLFMNGCVKYNLSLSLLSLDLSTILSSQSEAESESESESDSDTESKKTKTKTKMSSSMQEFVEIYNQLWKERYVILNKKAIEKSIEYNKVVDMSWVFGVTASSDSNKQAGITYLQVRLVLNNGQRVCFEVSLSQFYAFLKQMERAKAAMDSLNIQTL